MACQNPELDICNAERIPRFGNITRVYPLMWQLFAALDPQVDLILVRELESSINAREVAAVNEFRLSKHVDSTILIFKVRHD